ncbi:hypothetical protein Agub_g9260, partial [Astrephomene gubernaculifera]
GDSTCVDHARTCVPLRRLPKICCQNLANATSTKENHQGLVRMLSASPNVYKAILARELGGRRPGTATVNSRRLYQFICPNHKVQHLEAPEVHICRFSPCGQYLICFAGGFTQLAVYRFTGPRVSWQGEREEAELAALLDRFECFFSLLYRVPLAPAGEVLARDVVLFLGGGSLLLLASHSPLAPPQQHQPGQQQQHHQPQAGLQQQQQHQQQGGVLQQQQPLLPHHQHQQQQAGGGAGDPLHALPVAESTQLHVVRLSDGVRLSGFRFEGELVELGGRGAAAGGGGGLGVSAHEDLVAVLAVRSQVIHLLQVLRGGEELVPVRALGPHVREDDELVLRTAARAEERWRSSSSRAGREAAGGEGGAGGVPPPPPALRRSVTGGLVRSEELQGTEAAAATAPSAAALPAPIAVLYPPPEPYQPYQHTHVQQQQQYQQQHPASGSILPAASTATTTPAEDLAAAAAQQAAVRQQARRLQYEQLAAQGGPTQPPPPLQRSAQGGGVRPRGGLQGGLRAAARYGSGMGAEQQGRADEGPVGGFGAASSGQLGSHNGGSRAAAADAAGGSTMQSANRPHPQPPQQPQPQRPPPPPLPSEAPYWQHHQAANNTHARAHSRPHQLSRPSHPPLHSLHHNPQRHSLEAPGGHVPGQLFSQQQQQQRQHQQQQLAAHPAAPGGIFHAGMAPDGAPDGDGSFITGIKQRLLAYLYGNCLRLHANNPRRRQREALTLFRHIETYRSLIMRKVYLLDRSRLLIDMRTPAGAELGPGQLGQLGAVPAGGGPGLPPSQFFLLFDMHSTRVLGFKAGSADRVLQRYLAEATSAAVAPWAESLPPWDRFTYDNALAAVRAKPPRPQAGSGAGGGSSSAAALGPGGGGGGGAFADAGNAMASSHHTAAATAADRAVSACKLMQLLPPVSGSYGLSASPYLDSSLYMYDERVVSPYIRTRPCLEQPVSFRPRNRPDRTGFRLEPGPYEAMVVRDRRLARSVTYLFHPEVPFVMAVFGVFQQNSININFRI